MHKLLSILILLLFLTTGCGSLAPIATDPTLNCVQVYLAFHPNADLSDPQVIAEILFLCGDFDSDNILSAFPAGDIPDTMYYNEIAELHDEGRR